MNTNIIYKATSQTTNKSYIGASTKILETRKSQHIKLALRNPKNHFHNAINKYKPKDFIWEILELCTKETLYIREKYYIDLYDSYNTGYNMTPGGLGGKAGKYSVEDRLRLYNNRKLKCIYDNPSKGKKSIYFKDLNKCAFVENSQICLYIEQGWKIGMKKTNPNKKHMCALPKDFTEDGAYKRSGPVRPLIGTKNPRAKIMELYDNKNNLIFSGCIKEIISKTGIHRRGLKNSADENVSLCSSYVKSTMTHYKNNNTIQYRGWYTKWLFQGKDTQTKRNEELGRLL